MVLFFRKELAFSILLWLAAASPPREEAARRLALAEQQRANREHDRQTAARALAQAQTQAAAIAEQRVQQAAALRSLDQNVAAAAQRLHAAETAQAAAEMALQQRAAAFSALVPLMLRMSRYPAETVLAIPAPPDQALEGLLVAGGIAATLNAQAAGLRAQAAEAAKQRAATTQQAHLLALQQAQQAAAAAALETALALAQVKISAAEAEGQKAAEAVATLGTQAATLRDAIAAMDAARAAAEAKAARDAAEAEKHRQTTAAGLAHARQAALSRPPASQAIGRLASPVAGAVLRAFGAPAPDGTTTGLTIGTAPGAFVSSPCVGRVAFAAPFRSYGQLIILECGGGYDVVLAGLGHMAAAPGRTVRRGEPLGRMPDSGGRPALYVELRAHGQPIDPTPFLIPNG